MKWEEWEKVLKDRGSKVKLEQLKKKRPEKQPIALLPYFLQDLREGNDILNSIQKDPDVSSKQKLYAKQGFHNLLLTTQTAVLMLSGLVRVRSRKPQEAMEQIQKLLNGIDRIKKEQGWLK